MSNFYKTLQHLPWGENRPYNDGDLYNCLVIKTLMKDTEEPHYQTEMINVVDEVWNKILVNSLTEIHFLEMHIHFLPSLWIRWESEKNHGKQENLQMSTSKYISLFILKDTWTLPWVNLQLSIYPKPNWGGRDPLSWPVYQLDCVWQDKPGLALEGHEGWKKHCFEEGITMSWKTDNWKNIFNNSIALWFMTLPIIL